VIDHAAAATSSAIYDATSSATRSIHHTVYFHDAHDAVYLATQSALEPLIFNPTLPACYQAAKIEKTT
jgi:hypothetical protein